MLFGAIYGNLHLKVTLKILIKYYLHADKDHAWEISSSKYSSNTTHLLPIQ